MKKYLLYLPFLILLGLAACESGTSTQSEGCAGCGVFVNEADPTWTFELREDSTWTIMYPQEHKRTVEHGEWMQMGEFLVKLTRSDNKKVFRDIQWSEGKWGFEEYGWFVKKD